MGAKETIANFIGYGNALKINYFFQNPKPKEIIIDICASCNAACPFCPRLYMPQERSKGYMELELFKYILTEAKKAQIKNIRLYSTAEPTLHPHFDEIITLLKKDGFRVSVSTNASKINQHLDALMQVDVLQFSIEGWDKESYEKYRFPLKFDTVYENIKLFYEERKNYTKFPKISSNLLLTKETKLNQYVELWSDFLDEINVHFMLDATIYENDRFVSRKNPKLQAEYYLFEKKQKNFFCSYPFNILTIAFDGKIALCCNDFSASMKIGNIRDGIQSVFDSKVLNQVRNEFYQQDLKTCQECSFFSKPRQQDIEQIKTDISKLDKRFQNKLHTSF